MNTYNGGDFGGPEGADDECEEQASGASLPTEYTYTHRAMLRRGVPIDNSGIPPEGLDIPNVANREVLRPAGRKIANNIAEFFGDDTFPTVEASVSESSDKIWTGVEQEFGEYDNCDTWGSTSRLGVRGTLDQKNRNRIGAGSVNCTLTHKLLCASY